MKKIIVSGATGFIGSAFVKFLIERNVEVLSLGRKSFDELPRHVKDSISGSVYINLDMKEIESLDEIINTIGWEVGSDCIFFNLAWSGVSSLSDLDVEAQVNNVKWSVVALEQAAKIGCKTFIQVGTMEEAFTHRYLDLDHNRDSEYNRHVIYSVAKIAAKRSLNIKSKNVGIKFIYVLHSHVMGAYDTKDSFLQVTLKKLINNDELEFSSGEQLFDVISVDDCCIGYNLICLLGLSNNEYWVGSGEPKTLREYVERMYALFPSDKKMQFGKLSYNDIVLHEKDFSINKLVEHTGYKPSMTYEQTVKKLHEHLITSE